MSKKTSITLGVAVDIIHAAQLKDRLTTTLSKKLPVVINSSKVERADTAGLQLIHAFIKQVEADGNSVSWQKPSDPLIQTCEILGLEKALRLP